MKIHAYSMMARYSALIDAKKLKPAMAFCILTKIKQPMHCDRPSPNGTPNTSTAIREIMISTVKIKAKSVLGTPTIF